MPNVFAEDDPYYGKQQAASESADKGWWGSMKSDMGEAWDNTYGAMWDQIRGPQIGQTAPATYDWSGYNKGNQQQQAMNEMLLARAQGRGPSVAEGQLAQATDANRRSAMGQAASARGGAMQQQAAQRQAQSQGVQAQQQAAGQAATMRAQEQQAATSQYQNALQAQQQAEMMRQLQMGQQQLGYQQNETQRFGARSQAQQGGLGNIMGAAMGAASLFSDERAKTNVHDAERDVAEMFQALRAKRFEYKPGYGDAGEHMGVMAQDLERTPAGRTLVEHDAEGMRRIDPQRALMSLLAAGADIYDRLRKLEGGR